MENYENESKKTSTKRRKNINFNFYIFSITAAHRYKYWEKVEKISSSSLSFRVSKHSRTHLGLTILFVICGWVP